MTDRATKPRRHRPRWPMPVGHPSTGSHVLGRDCHACWQSDWRARGSTSRSRVTSRCDRAADGPRGWVCGAARGGRGKGLRRGEATDEPRGASSAAAVAARLPLLRCWLRKGTPGPARPLADAHGLPLGFARCRGLRQNRRVDRATPSDHAPSPWKERDDGHVPSRCDEAAPVEAEAPTLPMSSPSNVSAVAFGGAPSASSVEHAGTRRVRAVAVASPAAAPCRPWRASRSAP